MRSVNFVVLGEQTIANDFGKKGTVTDLTVYDRKESDIIRTWVVPNGFPEKIQPLLQAINIAEYVIFYVASLDRYTGEQILALDMLNKKNGILCHSYEVDETRLHSMIKGTVLQNYKKVDSPNIKEELVKLPSVSNDGPVQIVIDHSFDVKGVGTVIPDEVGGGDIITSDESLEVKNELEITFKQSPFYKENISENQMCLVSIGLQIKAAKFSSISPTRLILDKPVVCRKNEICLLVRPESTSVRVIGSGKIN